MCLHVGVCEYERAGAAAVCGTEVGVGDVVGAVHVADKGISWARRAGPRWRRRSRPTLRSRSSTFEVSRAGGGWWGVCGMGARKRGGRVMGRGEDGMEVLSLLYVCVCQGVCVYVCVK